MFAIGDHATDDHDDTTHLVKHKRSRLLYTLSAWLLFACGAFLGNAWLANGWASGVTDAGHAAIYRRWSIACFWGMLACVIGAAAVMFKRPRQD